MKMNRRIFGKKTSLALWAAVISLPIAAFGQQRTGSDGHALDASNQIGSGGVNVSSLPAPTQVNGNQIITGNVTGGYQFRGRQFHGIDLGPGYTDPSAFRGLLPGMMVDQFTRQSAGVATNSNPTVTPARQATPYYGQANTAILPSGFVPLPSGGGYVPAPTIAPNQLQNTSLDPLMVPTATLPKPGELNLPGPVDPTATTIFSASPLYGTRQWQLDNANENSFDENSGIVQFGPSGPIQQARANQSRLEQLRNDLSQNALPDNSAGGNPAPSGNGANGGYAPGGGVNSGGSPGNNSSGDLSHGPLSSANNSLKPLQPVVNTNAQQVRAGNLAPVSGDVATEQTNRQYLGQLYIPSAAQQSAQFAELRRRLSEYENGKPKSDAEANREFMAAVQASRQISGIGGAPGAPQPAGSPLQPGGAQSAPGKTYTGPVTVGPISPISPGAAAAAGAGASGNTGAPLQVGNLEEGVKAQGLRQLIIQGEDLVQRQQYAKAIETYNDAVAVAPNNPLLLIGRAEAELGGAYYRQSEADLRAAFQLDHAVLMGQFDLQKRLGDAKLQSVVADLKQIATDNKDNATPVFLLAYIAYNTHHEDQVNGWLDIAQKRNGGKDDVIPLLKRYWTLNSPTTQPENLNK
jgi:tetratricopeptide (TPR) repeat protein